MFTHLIYLIDNKSLEILCKRVSIHDVVSVERQNQAVTQRFRISNAFPTIYYLTVRYVVPFRFPPFYLSYLYFFRQYIHFHRYFIKSIYISFVGKRHCFLLLLLLFLYSILLLILFLCPHTISRKC